MAQHDIRMDATNSLMDMEASYFETRQTGNLMSVLSADVAQLEDIISDASTSMIVDNDIRTAFGIMFLDVSNIRLILFAPLALIVPMVFGFLLEFRGNIGRQEKVPEG